MAFGTTGQPVGFRGFGPSRGSIGLGDSLLPTMHWAIPIPGGVPGITGDVYLFPPTVDGTVNTPFDPNAQIPAGARTINAPGLATTSASAASGGGFAANELDAYNPSSAGFGKNWTNPDKSVGMFDASLAVDVGYLESLGLSAADATARAQAAAAKLGKAVVPAPTVTATAPAMKAPAASMTTPAASANRVPPTPAPSVSVSTPPAAASSMAMPSATVTTDGSQFTTAAASTETPAAAGVSGGGLAILALLGIGLAVAASKGHR